MAQIAYGDVLADVQVEISATSGQHESAGDGGSPDDFIVDKTLDVLQHRVPMVAGFGKCSVGLGTEQHRVRAIYADEPQLAQALGNGFGVLTHVGGKRRLRIAGALTNPQDAGSGVTLEN